jgi:hypothetical protein
MPIYERAIDGKVVERVQPIEGDYEDTRLGLLAMEDGSEWRAALDETPPASPSTPDPSDRSSQQRRR